MNRQALQNNETVNAKTLCESDKKMGMERARERE